MCSCTARNVVAYSTLLIQNKTRFYSLFNSYNLSNLTTEFVKKQVYKLGGKTKQIRFSTKFANFANVIFQILSKIQNKFCPKIRLYCATFLAHLVRLK